MDFNFQYKVKPENLWVLGMVGIYKSMVGMINIIFTISMILLAIRFYSGTGLNLRLMIVAGISVFPVLQPLFIYLRSRKIVNQMPENMEMNINSTGITISSKESSSHMDFSDIKSIFRIRGMLILYTQSKQGFILNKQTLAGNKSQLYDFIISKIG